MSTRPWVVVLGSFLLAGVGCSSAPHGSGPEGVGVSRSALGGVTWIDAVGVNVVGSSLTKTAADGWGDAGASTTQSLGGDGNTQFTTAEATTYKMAGLSHLVTDANYTDIDFGVFLESDGTLGVFEGGAYVGTFGTYAANDVFTIQVTGSKVTFLQNGTLFYTSSKTPTLPLVFVASLYSNGATINDVTLVASSGGITWTDLVGVDTVGNSLTSIAADGWGDAGGASVESLSGDGTVQFTTAETTTYKIAGLTHAVTDSSYDDIDFGIFLAGDGSVGVFEDGTEVGSFGTYAANDVFTVQVTGSQVTYLQNGTVFYTSTKTPTLPLVFDATLYSDGATVNAVVLAVASGGGTWTDVVGVEATNTGLTKNTPDGWNAGAATTASLSGNGTVQFSTAEANTYKMAGLTHAVTDSSYDDIDFGVFLESDGTLGIFEDGTYVGTFGSYRASDAFTVQVSGTQVSYLQNGTVFYTSTKTPTLPLVFVASLYSDGATVQGVTLTP
jgi:hypothetical protein